MVALGETFLIAASRDFDTLGPWGSSAHPLVQHRMAVAQLNTNDVQTRLFRKQAICMCMDHSVLLAPRTPELFASGSARDCSQFGHSQIRTSQHNRKIPYCVH